MYILKNPSTDCKLEIVKELIKNGANVNAVSKFGTTALMYASGLCKLNVVETLIKAGADINAINFKDKTVLMYAYQNGNLGIVKYLRELILKVYTTKTGQKQTPQKNLNVIRALPGGTDYQTVMDRFYNIVKIKS
jgi:ankyrin repeat protein